LAKHRETAILIDGYQENRVLQSQPKSRVERSSSASQQIKSDPTDLMMTFPNSKQREAVLYSGGIDSSVLLASLVQRGVFAIPIYLQSGFHWQKSERIWAEAFISTLDRDLVSPVVDLYLPLDDLYQDHWSVDGKGVPDRNASDLDVDLPGRNAMAILKAALWCLHHQIDRLSIGTLSTSPFADAKEEFIERVAQLANTGRDRTIEIIAPFADRDKAQIMLEGQRLSLEKTFSCLAPRNDQHCGDCNKCRERRDAFSGLGADPTVYATSP